MSSTLTIGDSFRDHTAALLRTRYDNVRTEIQMTAKKADIFFEYRFGPRRTVHTAVECKKWGKALTRDDVKSIIDDYRPAFEEKEINELWIISDRTPAAGARDYADAFEHIQIMTALEFEQSIVDFRPLLSYLVNEFRRDKISKYFIPPSYYDTTGNKQDLHTHIISVLNTEDAKPVAIWAGYGMGKTSYARFLASQLAEQCLNDYGARIPILINLGDFTTAPNLDTLIFSQLSNFYGIKHFSSAQFKILNSMQRFVLIFDGFDEMKFGMAPNDFAYISSEMRRIATANSKLLLLGRPDAIQTDDEANRLLSSRLFSQATAVRADDGPDFDNLRLSFFSKAEYLHLIRQFLAQEAPPSLGTQAIDEKVKTIEQLDLEDILQRPVQSKMLAEIVLEPEAQIDTLSRFTLYDLFIKKILRREEEKSARRHLDSSARLKFMRQLAWWLWTEKKTRTFTALEVPLELVQQFQIPGISLDGLRRELLIGSLVEERNIGHFLTEKAAGVFYFPHTSFTEFLVADYIMSADFRNSDVKKVPDALYGEVPTFLSEHPSGEALFSAYERMKKSKVSIHTRCLDILLKDPMCRAFIIKIKPNYAHPWDVCLHYFWLKAANDLKARQFIFDCLNSGSTEIEFAAMFCIVYEESSIELSVGSGIATLLTHIFRKIGILTLIAAAEKGVATVRSRHVNHLAAVMTKCVKIVPREARVTFDFSAFSDVALIYIGGSCAIDDLIENMRRKIFSIPANDLLSSIADRQERAYLAELFHKGGQLELIASL